MKEVTMTEEFIQPVLITPVARLADPETVYLVAAFREQFGKRYWSFTVGNGSAARFPSREKAEEFARSLGPHWTHIRIIQVELR
jgi:hypothetical protein